MPQICDLEEEEGEPIQRGDQGIERKRGRVMCILAPDRSSVFLSMFWHAIRIVDAGDHSQEPCQNGQNLVGPNSLGIVGFAKSERIGVRDRHCEVVGRVLRSIRVRGWCMSRSTCESLVGCSRTAKKRRHNESAMLFTTSS